MVFNFEWKQIAQKLQKDDAIMAAFGASYTDGLTEKNLADAIAVTKNLKGMVVLPSTKGLGWGGICSKNLAFWGIILKIGAIS